MIHRRLDGEPKTLNPILATTDAEQIVVALLVAEPPRLRREAEPRPRPRRGGLRLAGPPRLHGPPQAGRRWEDGTPVTSADVVFTLNAVMDPKTPALTRRALFEGFEKAEVVDARTARVTFRTASSGRLDAFNLSLLSAAAWKDGDLATHPRNRNPLANGPYRLGAWEAGRTIELVRNTQYVGERREPSASSSASFPRPRRPSPGFSRASSTRCASASSRRRDSTRRRTPGAPRRSLRRARVHLPRLEERLSALLGPAVRRALTMLIDRESIAATSTAASRSPRTGRFRPASGRSTRRSRRGRTIRDRPRRCSTKPASGGDRTGSGARAASGSPSRSPRDRKRPAAPDRRGRPAVVPEGRNRDDDPADRVGGVRREGGRGGVRGVGRALSLDPNPDLAVSWHSTQVPPTGLNNAFYRNPEVDTLIDRLRTTFDRGRGRSASSASSSASSTRTSR